MMQACLLIVVIWIELNALVALLMIPPLAPRRGTFA
jgi:hypothetical protein